MSESAGLTNVKTIPASLAIENRGTKITSIIIAGLFFAVYFTFWLDGRELLSQEGLFAACANEYRPGLPITAHGVIQRNIQPLFPALVSL